MLSTGAQISSSRGRVHSPNTTSQRFLRTERPSVTAGGSRGNVLHCKCQWHADACGGQIVPATIHVVDAAPNSTVRGFSDARQPGDNLPVICLAVKGRLVNTRSVVQNAITLRHVGRGFFSSQSVDSPHLSAESATALNRLSRYRSQVP